MLIPIMLWMFSGFYISRHLMDTGLLSSLAVALVLGLIIGIVDRSFIATPKMKGGYLLLVYRLGFAVITTILGALAIDLMVFAGDLEEYRSTQQETALETEKESYIERHLDSREVLVMDLEKAKSTEERDKQSYLDEMEGVGGTGTYGEGKVALAKKKMATKAEIETERTRERLEAFDKKLEKDAESHAKKVTEKSDAAILSKIEDLHAYLKDRPIGELIYWVFFLFIFFLEGAFVVYKFAASKSLFEDMLLAEEEIGLYRLMQLRERRRKYSDEDALLGHSASTLRKMADTAPSRRII